MMGSPGASEGTKYDRERRQLNAALLEYKIQTMPDADAIAVHVGVTDEYASDGGPRGSKAFAEASQRRHCRRDSERALAVRSRGGHDQLPMNARARMGAHAGAGS